MSRGPPNSPVPQAEAWPVPPPWGRSGWGLKEEWEMPRLPLAPWRVGGSGAGGVPKPQGAGRGAPQKLRGFAKGTRSPLL